MYTRARNQVKWACKKAEREMLARHVKANPKAFFNLIQFSSVQACGAQASLFTPP